MIILPVGYFYFLNQIERELFIVEVEYIYIYMYRHESIIAQLLEESAKLRMTEQVIHPIILYSSNIFEV